MAISSWKRGKGAAWEREVCRRLSLWCTKGKRDDLFWRSAMSGGRATLRHLGGNINKSQVGDICAIDDLGFRCITKHVIVECKFHKDLNVWYGIMHNAGRLWRFWHKECDKAHEAGREPFMVCKDNYTSTGLILTTRKAVGRLTASLPTRGYGGLLPAIHEDDAVAQLLGWRQNPYLFALDDIVPRLPKGKK